MLMEMVLPEILSLDGKSKFKFRQLKLESALGDMLR